MIEFRLYYPDFATSGAGKVCWERAKNDEVQALVILYDDCTHEVLTGLEFYDPFGWGAKTGSRIPYAEFSHILYRVESDLMLGAEV